MKVLIILVVIVTIVAIFVQYSRNKNLKKLFITLLTFSAIITLAVVGNLTRQVMPLFIAHIILLIFSWIALIVYMIKERYYWWIIFAPVITIVLFLLLEMAVGSSHKGLLPT
jgi:peptidoglycan/LPS O-acetylase OafA/YrhL